ncbi:MAG: GNAT family N-acetyltransferase [Rickettsiales bacterium]|nr:GNAT family N-acetyltransferase [Rickettsiales bacterium]
MTVKNNAAAHRYELVTDGHVCVADYEREGNKLIITHVGVPEALRGQGIAAQVMKGVVDDAKSQGLEIVPVCSYAVAYLKRNPS